MEILIPWRMQPRVPPVETDTGSANAYKWSWTDQPFNCSHLQPLDWDSLDYLNLVRDYVGLPKVRMGFFASRSSMLKSWDMAFMRQEQWAYGLQQRCDPFAFGSWEIENFRRDMELPFDPCCYFENEYPGSFETCSRQQMRVMTAHNLTSDLHEMAMGFAPANCDTQTEMSQLFPTGKMLVDNYFKEKGAREMLLQTEAWSDFNWTYFSPSNGVCLSANFIHEDVHEPFVDTTSGEVTPRVWKDVPCPREGGAARPDILFNSYGPFARYPDWYSDAMLGTFVSYDETPGSHTDVLLSAYGEDFDSTPRNYEDAEQSNRLCRRARSSEDEWELQPRIGLPNARAGLYEDADKPATCREGIYLPNGLTTFTLRWTPSECDNLFEDVPVTFNRQHCFTTDIQLQVTEWTSQFASSRDRRIHPDITEWLLRISFWIPDGAVCTERRRLGYNYLPLGSFGDVEDQDDRLRTIVRDESILLNQFTRIERKSFREAADIDELIDPGSYLRSPGDWLIYVVLDIELEPLVTSKILGEEFCNEWDVRTEDKITYPGEKLRCRESQAAVFSNVGHYIGGEHERLVYRCVINETDFPDKGAEQTLKCAQLRIDLRCVDDPQVPLWLFWLIVFIFGIIGFLLAAFFYALLIKPRDQADRREDGDMGRHV